MSEHEQETLLHDILNKVSSFDGRLIVLEERSFQSQNLRKWVMGLVALVLVQLGGFAYAWGQFTNKLDSINLVQFEGQISTALQVLADHGTELQSVRNEQLRVRTVIDSVRDEIAIRTQKRFTSDDGARLEQRILRLENKAFQ